MTRFNTEAEWLAARHKNVNSTEVAALFSMSPYMTAFELGLEKSKDEPSVFKENARTRWGKRLQDSIALGVCDEYQVAIEPLDLVYEQVPEMRLGSSFDYEIVGAPGVAEDNQLRTQVQELGAGVLEIKNVDSLVFAKQWLDGEAPAHIEIQLQTQLGVKNRQWGAIAALVGGNTTHLIVRKADPVVFGRIMAKVAGFWQNLAQGKLPEPMLPADASAVIAMYQHSAADKVYDGSRDAELKSMCEQYCILGAAIRNGEQSREAIKAQILERIKDATVAYVDGFKIGAGMVPPAEVKAYTRPGYRNLRVTEKKIGR